uniref:Uncharacterized protein n=1 Tax=Branchiostoma floridae TaxID=7739 RepID=C3ZID8_BRAFL|eukprot:XP_002591652.1 hypothetical protein BRAFLDRAFT_80742 [Branchiostoma floridae]
MTRCLIRTSHLRVYRILISRCLFGSFTWVSNAPVEILGFLPSPDTPGWYTCTAPSLLPPVRRKNPGSCHLKSAQFGLWRKYLMMSTRSMMKQVSRMAETTRAERSLDGETGGARRDPSPPHAEEHGTSTTCSETVSTSRTRQFSSSGMVKTNSADTRTHSTEKMLLVRLIRTPRIPSTLHHRDDASGFLETSIFPRPLHPMRESSPFPPSLSSSSWAHRRRTQLTPLIR